MDIKSRFEFGHGPVAKFLNDPINMTSICEQEKEVASRIHNYFEETSHKICMCVTSRDHSGIAVLSAYALNASKLLIITHNDAKQMHAAFCDNNDSFLVKTKSVPREYFIDNLRPFCLGVINNIRQVNKAFSDELIIANAKTVIENEELSIFDLPNSADLIIVPDAHRYSASSWKNISNHFSKGRKLFLSAKDGEFLVDPFNPNYQNKCTC